MHLRAQHCDHPQAAGAQPDGGMAPPLRALQVHVLERRGQAAVEMVCKRRMNWEKKGCFRASVIGGAGEHDAHQGGAHERVCVFFSRCSNPISKR